MNWPPQFPPRDPVSGFRTTRQAALRFAITTKHLIIFHVTPEPRPKAARGSLPHKLLIYGNKPRPSAKESCSRGLNADDKITFVGKTKHNPPQPPIILVPGQKIVVLNVMHESGETRKNFFLITLIALTADSQHALPCP